ncbi:MAG: site-specific integrase [Streptosporangiaceae bacterium]
MATAARRGHGEGSVYRDAANGTWVGAISLGWTPDGKRIRRKVTGRTKTEVREKLGRLRDEAKAGLKTSASYTLSKAVDDWATEALDGLAAKTVRSHVDLLRPVTMLIGNVPLRDLTAQDVRRALAKLAEARSTRTMASTHNVLVRAIRHAEANDHVGRNVASLVKPPRGKTGRPSRAMTAAEAAALLAAASDDRRIGAYVILSLTTGIRTEEARALRWDHVDLDGDLGAMPPVPPHVAVWRSVRAHGDTKTEKSRRTLALPQSAVAALKDQRRWQAEARLAAGPLWYDKGLVFTTRAGAPLDASHVRRDFRALCKKAGITGVWAPRELRHTFVSVMSNSGVAVEEIAHLAGHASSRTTETIYRHELRPVITTGADVMDKIFIQP